MSHHPLPGQADLQARRAELLDILQGLRTQIAAGHLAPWDEEWFQQRIAVVSRELDLLGATGRPVQPRPPPSRSMRPLRRRPATLSRR